MMIISRKDLEAAEHERLRPQAAFSDATRGRETPVELDPYRTEYQRDRDRILHCKAFRRLSHKTQVFLTPEGDHYRTRLTHTLEVAQISRSIARVLGLNEDLTEAIALGHDLGHTPFGHTGESALDDALKAIAADYPDAPKAYHHNEQSLRIVESLEYEGHGLNLTWEVRDGILGHTGGHMPETLEGRIVRVADRIAYVNHDIDDAVRAKVLSEDELPKAPLEVLGHRHAARITTMINDLIETSADIDDIRMSPRVWDAMMEMRSYLFDNVYFSARAKAEEPKAYRVVQGLFQHYLTHSDELSAEFKPKAGEEPIQRIVDYVAGMTDRFAIRDFERIFIPKKWLV
ncbi:MAG TPA: deoxyguanosinetriphosphate triphosphohydrolase [Coriobacteriia bacterium]|nr:deoxyguanosinetriphosphate triphosphohydrolase [Coriobacteriia bacterium]